MKTTRLFSLMLLASFLFVGQEAKAQLITWRESVIDQSSIAGRNSVPSSHASNSSAAAFAYVSASQTSKLDVLESALLIGQGPLETASFWLIVCRSTDLNVLDDYNNPYNYGTSGAFSKFYIGPPTSIQNFGSGQFGWPVGFARFEGLNSLNIELNAGEAGYLALVHDETIEVRAFRQNMSNLGPNGLDQTYLSGRNPKWLQAPFPLAVNAYGVVPEPSSLIALAIGAASFLRRRRRSVK